MRLRYLSMGLFVAACFAAQSPAAVIYKWTDANGLVHYSDQPQPGAERIVTQPPNISHASPVQSPRSNSATQANARGSIEEYAAFEIDAPVPEQTFDDTSVTVRLHLEPTLKPNHAISLYLNGQLLENQPSDSMVFTILDLARGTYILTATVLDRVGGGSRSTRPVTFYIHQPSMLAPQSPLRKKKN